MIRKFMVAAAFTAIVAFGLPISATNVRPVTINAPPAGEQSLQYYLNQIYGCTDCVDAATGQQAAALWQEIGAPPQQIAPVVQAHDASDGDPFGIFTGTNTTTATLIDVFTSGAPGGANAPSASIRFNANGTITISDTTGGANCTADHVNCGTFSGISQSDFGFYINTGSQNLFTSDSANASLGGSTAHAVTYVSQPSDKWTIAFEDGTDFDYNDRIVTIESITPIPEPAAVVLFGTILVAFASLRRKKLSL